jgi:hypothetical protein
MPFASLIISAWRAAAASELYSVYVCGGERAHLIFFQLARSHRRFMNNILLRDQFSHAQVESQFIYQRATMQPVCVCYLPICLSCNMRLHFIKVKESMCQVSGATQFIRQAHQQHSDCFPQEVIRVRIHTHIFSVQDNCLNCLERNFPNFQLREMNLIFFSDQSSNGGKEFLSAFYLTYTPALKCAIYLWS